MLNNFTIEEEAANEVSSIMRRTGRVIPNITTKDKGISWDGELTIHDESVIEKRNIPKNSFLYRIPVQVKGKEVESFEKFSAKYSFKLSDLENYLKDGGVIIFLGAIKEDKESYGFQRKIFYCSLLPLDLKFIINSCEQNDQKSKNIEFKELPKNPDEILKILDLFNYTKEKQPNILMKSDFKIEEMNNIKVQLKNLDGRLKLGEEVYVYGANKDINFDIPLTVAKFFEMKDFKDIDINIGDDIFFNKVERTFKEDGSINVRFGDEITFNVNKENKSTLNFKIKGIDLEESIKTIKFILALNREKKFSMNGVRLDLDEICLDEEFIKSLERDLETLNKTKEVLEFFGIGFDIDLRKYKFDIYNEIMALYEGIIKGNDVRIKSEEKLIIFSKKIADENILLFAIKEGDTYKLFDFFKNIEKKIGFFREENGKFKLITPYVTLDTKNINCINWDNDIIMESILKHEYDNNIGDELNLLVLRIIEAFDKYSCDHLDLALNILEYLQEKDFDKDILLINKAQIFKRKGISLSDDIIGKLLYIRDNNGDEFKCCVEILLGNNPSFKFYFNKLSNEAKEVFRTWPIYTLINE
ncbi:hypothetical protein [Clostridium perfringens]|uniref:hypothetical protein n=1 Tax=Clostridium perfringens TaxID=1502 RepID=UPI001A34039C|nr:hypothetical protein [Clostridium perfringens]